MTNDAHAETSGDVPADMENPSPKIPIGEDYLDYTYDPDEIVETARTEASSAYDYKYENGRRYHAYREGSYPIPNDDLNNEHQRIGHHIFSLLLKDRLFLAPIDEPKNVIDLGTGTGLWAFDMAERYENTKILGVDLTPPPQSLFNNLQFQVDDFTQEWVPNDHDGFDLVHIRLLVGATNDWLGVYSKAFKNLQSGGYIQQIEFDIEPRCDDGTLPADNVFQSMFDLVLHLGNRGRPFAVTGSMRQRMEHAGFVDIVEVRHKLPLGPWSSDPMYQSLGMYFEMFWRTGCQGWLMQSLVKELGWTPSQVNSLVEDTIKAIDQRTSHVYFYTVIMYGRKP